MGERVGSSEAAKELGIGLSSIGKYAQTLEKRGVVFHRGPNRSRMFDESDLDMVRSMMERIAEGMTIEQAGEMAAAAWRGKPEIEVLQVEEAGLDKLLDQIAILEQQQAEAVALNKALVKQVERLAEKIEERERDQELMQRLENTRAKQKRKGIAFLRPLTALAGKR